MGTTNLRDDMLRQRLDCLGDRLVSAGGCPPKALYAPPLSLLRELKSTEYSPESLSKLFGQLGLHAGARGLELLPVRVSGYGRKASSPGGRSAKWVVTPDGVVCENPEREGVASQQTVGQYTNAGGRGQIINVIIEENFGLREVLAIVGHETSHHLLTRLHVVWEDEQENELMTDLATCWFGFGHLLYRAYHPDARAHGKLGYLDHETLWRALETLWHKEQSRPAIRRLQESTESVEK